jgi:hypothetical protein
MQPRARRSRELTGRQITCMDLPPRSIRRKSLSAATLATRPLQRPSRHPLTPSREYRRRRTHPRQRQRTDRERADVEALVNGPFQGDAPSRPLAAPVAAWVAERLLIDLLLDGPHMGRPWGSGPRRVPGELLAGGPQLSLGHARQGGRSQAEGDQERGQRNVAFVMKCEVPASPAPIAET